MIKAIFFDADGTLLSHKSTKIPDIGEYLEDSVYQIVVYLEKGQEELMVLALRWETQTKM